MQRFVSSLGVAASFLLLAVGCGKGASEKAVESAMAAQGQKADVSIESDTMKITTQDGSMSFGEGTEIPDNWPKDIPVYKGLKIMTAISTPDGASLQGTTSDAADKVAAYYKEQASKNGWTEDATFKQSEMTSLIYKKEDRTLSVIASSAGSETSVAISLSNQ